VTAAQAVGLPMLAYGRNTGYQTTSPHLGTNVIDDVILANSTRTIKFDWTPANAGEIYLIGGDSGGPAFVRAADGDLALIGTHYAVSNGTQNPNPGDFSVSAFVPEYVAALNAEMALTGHQVTVAPVPEPAGLLALVGIALAFGAGQARRVRTKKQCAPVCHRPGSAADEK
jgi:hypothetical protein